MPNIRFIDAEQMFAHSWLTEHKSKTTFLQSSMPLHKEIIGEMYVIL